MRDADLLLRERARHASPTVDVPLPSHLSVSALVTLRRDPAELARRLRRPMPAAPAPQARRGTAFHAWLEERFGAAKLVDLDELPGSGDEFAAPDGALAELQDAFLASEWADRQPAEVEVPFETPLGPLTLRGRIDAVFQREDGGYEVIDWKTGPPPSGAELAAAAVQLAAYRLGWSRLTGVPGRAGQRRLPPRRGEGDPAPGRPARRGRPARPGHGHRGLVAQGELGGTSPYRRRSHRATMWSSAEPRPTAIRRRTVSALDLPAPTAGRGRRPALDNLRVALIAAVIVIHGVMGYAAFIDGWPYADVQEVHLPDAAVIVVFALFAPSGLFMMALLFLVAGLLTAPSVDRKGPARFARARLLRLGIPFALFALLVWPSLLYGLYRPLGHTRLGYSGVLPGTLPDSGPLWFVGVLLLLSLGYAGLRGLHGREPPRGPADHHRGPARPRGRGGGDVLPDPAGLPVRRADAAGPQRMAMAGVHRTVRHRDRGLPTRLAGCRPRRRSGAPPVTSRPSPGPPSRSSCSSRSTSVSPRRAFWAGCTGRRRRWRALEGVLTVFGSIWLLVRRPAPVEPVDSGQQSTRAQCVRSLRRPPPRADRPGAGDAARARRGPTSRRRSSWWGEWRSRSGSGHLLVSRVRGRRPRPLISRWPSGPGSRRPAASGACSGIQCVMPGSSTKR